MKRKKRGEEKEEKGVRDGGGGTGVREEGWGVWR